MANPYGPSPIASAAPTGNVLVDALLVGQRWTPSILEFSFPTANAVWAGNYEDPTDAYGSLSAAQQDIVRSAVRLWDAVVALDFVEVAETTDDVGDIRFAFSRLDPSPWWPNPMPFGWGYFPETHPRGGDVWFNSDFNSPDGPAWGPDTYYGYYYMAVLHEIGHALGLKHPFDPGAHLPPEYDQRAYTIMSYNNGYSREPTTPMLLDIAAVQQLYGADTRSHGGDDTYRYDDSQTYFETIWDTGGSDTIVCASTGSIEIDLRAGEASRIGGLYGLQTGQRVESIWIAYDCVIENAVGGAGNDELIGNAAANRLDGGAGGDRMSGGAGNDRYTIDNRRDVVVESSKGGTDTLLCSISVMLPSQVENAQLTGSAKLNLTGNTLNNSLIGNAAANRLDGGAGNDRLSGGAGTDSFTFTTKLSARHNVDAIADFSRADDRLLLDHHVFDALGSKVSKGELRLGTSARDANDHLIYDSARGRLYYDDDGRGGEAAVLFATLQPGTVLGYDDFWVV